LLPLAWENNSAPAFAFRPQEVINRQLTNASDLIVAIFWTRFGTPAAVAPSRTVEEIEERPRLGKPATLYFSNEPVRPDSIDEERYKALRDFKFFVHAYAELRMEQRGVTEVDVRAMLERATAFEPSVVEGRFMIRVARDSRPWIVIVEPDNDASLLVVVTAYEVSE
jgi:Domain of unknown function (DUF4258)